MSVPMFLMNPNSPTDIDAIIHVGTAATAACAVARNDALLDHKRTGDPIVVWENGQIVWIPAGKIDVDGADTR